MIVVPLSVLDAPTSVLDRGDVEVAVRRRQIGKVKVEITSHYKLADAQAAHRDPERRKTTGSVIVLP